ncbi:MAG TPA: hypothetical protein VMA54_14080 [Steroidobacteraceae bacterium]|nr:hypothetical protein [Steroidobacteraceae bacterium]
MKNNRLTSSLALIATVAAWACPGVGGSACAAMAPVEPYLMANRDQEIALARSAAPASIAAHAEVMVLERHGYVTAVKGTNGFVCLVVRSWDNELDSTSAVFWNPKFRAPFCLNPPGARYELTLYMLRTRWAIAGASETEMAEREKAAWAAGKLQEPKAGAMCYMMSRLGNLGEGSAWHSHVMFYVPNEKASDWGANLPHVPVMGAASDHATVFFVIVPFWSDGTPESGAM